jgi:acetyl esterase/lipase
VAAPLISIMNSKILAVVGGVIIVSLVGMMVYVTGISNTRQSTELIATTTKKTRVSESDLTISKQVSKKCGDGVCDNIEKLNSGLCPEDCNPKNTQTQILDLKYSRIDSEAVKLDLYFPNKTCEGKFPLVVNIHGGAFKAGDKRAPRNIF